MQGPFGRNKTNLPTYLGGASQWEQTPYPARSRNPVSCEKRICAVEKRRQGDVGKAHLGDNDTEDASKRSKVVRDAVRTRPCLYTERRETAENTERGR